MKITCKLKREFKEIETSLAGKWTDKVYGWGYKSEKDYESYEQRYRLEIYAVNDNEDYSDTLISNTDWFKPIPGGITYINFVDITYCYSHDRKHLYCNNLTFAI